MVLPQLLFKFQFELILTLFELQVECFLGLSNQVSSLSKTWILLRVTYYAQF